MQFTQLHNCDQRVLYNLITVKKTIHNQKKYYMCPVGFILFWQSKAQIQNSRCRDIYKMSVEVENISSFFRGHKSERQAYHINLISSWKTTSTQSARPESSHFIDILILKSGLTGMPRTWSQIWLWTTVTFIKKQFGPFFAFLFVDFFVCFFLDQWCNYYVKLRFLHERLDSTILGHPFEFVGTTIPMGSLDHISGTL